MARNLFNTGNDKTTIADSEKLAAGSGAANAFNITWLKVKELIVTYINSAGLSLLKIGGVTVINTSRDFNGAKGIFTNDVTTDDDFILTTNDSGRMIGTTSAGLLAALLYLNSSDNLTLGDSTLINSVILHYGGSKKIETIPAGALITGTVTSSNLIATSMPTSPGATGTLWNDGGTVKIS